MSSKFERRSVQNSEITVLLTIFENSFMFGKFECKDPEFDSLTSKLFLVFFCNSQMKIQGVYPTFTHSHGRLVDC